MGSNVTIFKYSVSYIQISNFFSSFFYFPLAMRYFENMVKNAKLLSILNCFFWAECDIQFRDVIKTLSNI